MANFTLNPMKFVALTAVMTLTGFTAFPASAASGDTIAVKIDRAELVTEAGVKRVYSKLERAAKAACNDDYGVRGLARRLAAKKCTAETLDGFVRQLNSSRMTALYNHQYSKAG